MQSIKVAHVFSEGIGLGPIYLVKEEAQVVATYSVTTPQEVERELERFRAAVAKTAAHLAVIAADNAIFAGHLEIVNDIALHDSVFSKIRDEKLNAEQACSNAIEDFRMMFAMMDDAYMQQRAADMVDIGSQLMAALQNRSDDRFADLKEASVIIARDLYPSDTARLDLNNVLGFITEEGGSTSHVSIMAKSLEIPALVGVKGILEAAAGAKRIALDASSGEVYLDPTDEIIAEFSAKQKRFCEEKRALLAAADEAVRTQDGKLIKCYANVGSIQDIRKAKDLRVDGVGLFRTEFLYMENDHFPTEAEQFEVYREAVQILGGEIIIRTLDIGGDKRLTYYDFLPEENPFLGLRAIRICLSKPEILLTQFRAILRASAFGKLRIMIPMLSTLTEADRARELFEQAKDELRDEGVDFDRNIAFGMMMETPASVLMADEFAKDMDFFSIGTNDLTQYVLACDRGNKEIKDLYNPFDPAVLRSIKRIIDAGQHAGIEVGMCGEFASNPLATKLLLGLGLDEFSMAATSTLRVKAELRAGDVTEYAKRAAAIIQSRTAADVVAELNNW